jgi:ribosomal-protein-alanine N-acetyltransferase
MPKVELRHQKVFDAKRFFEILNNPKFIFISAKPKTIEEEKVFLKKNFKKQCSNTEHNFTILFDGAIVGACGFKIDQHRPHIGEIGYFVDEVYWGKGIAPEAVRLLEEIGFGKLGLARIEIWMNPLNKASERVAIKSGYLKEGVMKKAQKNGDAYSDENLYAKVI